MSTKGCLEIKHRTGVTDKEKREIFRAYRNGETLLSLEQKHNVSRQSIANWMAQRGLNRRRRRRALDEGVFDVVTPESAYWVGFLMADGCVGEYGYAKILSLCIARRDRQHLLKFRRFLKSNHSIRSHSSSKGLAQGHTCQLSVSSARLFAALSHFGIVQRKSLVAEAPATLLDNRDFWRGMVDGDGSLQFRRHYDKTAKRFRQLVSLELCGTRSVVVQFQKFLKSLAPNLRAAPRRSRSIWRITACNDNAFRAALALYRDATVYLTRKLTVAQKIIQFHQGLPV